MNLMYGMGSANIYSSSGAECEEVFKGMMIIRTKRSKCLCIVLRCYGEVLLLYIKELRQRVEA